ncbi:hypothetical protein BY996DRAFT_6408678 [Phakopsora pachyrhizi]|nr:hypothetical protein BY996DRAFT_6408678 [Phakopsora pachyrhizi]
MGAALLMYMLILRVTTPQRAQGTGHSLKPVLQDGIKPKRNPTQGSTGDACQLFDPQKHNTVKFSALKRNGKRKLQPVMLINPDSNTQSKAIRKCFYEHDQNSNSQQALVDGQKTNLLGHLKHSYKQIVSLETILKDKKHAAKDKKEALKA